MGVRPFTGLFSNTEHAEYVHICICTVCALSFAVCYRPAPANIQRISLLASVLLRLCQLGTQESKIQSRKYSIELLYGVSQFLSLSCFKAPQ